MCVGCVCRVCVLCVGCVGCVFVCVLCVVCVMYVAIAIFFLKTGGSPILFYKYLAGIKGSWLRFPSFSVLLVS